ncbi:hypothetical protein GO986_07000 [Deinococcus sp. HMF7620]|uniref:Uncharacterized protein n=1 Tax=Deinococcus arboris TaxID=2682977 RepID=A0A7C9I2G3_9DEIO|nr:MULTISPECIES: hypothetical protein [Deinococcus]MBZ9751928.1 hypothetical protein [Deinococcus betulae]MVN86511.1 hypothetical protein [Deinococcus arboris]
MNTLALRRALVLGAFVAMPLLLGWQAQQDRAARTRTAHTYTQAVTDAARRAWQDDPGKPFLEVGSVESCLGPAYRGVAAPARLTACEVSRLPNGFEVTLTLGTLTLSTTAP